MQVVLHIGAHCTDDDLLIKTLVKNAPALAAQGTAVPKPSAYRNMLRDALRALSNGAPSDGVRDRFLDQILEDKDVDRLILSNESFVNLTHRIFDGGVFYGLAPKRLKAMADMMQGDELEIYMGIRNPATFLSATFGRVEGRSLEQFLQGADPMDLRWSDVIASIRAAVPEAPLTVWCNEDTPLIWTQIIRDIAGLEHTSKLKGGFDLIRSIMSREGMVRFKSYVAENPPQTEVHLRRIIAAFLDKYAIEEQLEDELNAPGITDEQVVAMTDSYEEDLYEIEQIPGVNFITP